jgi:hypothetical protein
MRMHVWVVVGMMLAAVYVLPIAVGLYVSRLRTAVMLAVASFCGLYATVWSALRPLLAPLASIATPTELFTVLILSLLAGSLQAALLATVGHGLRHLLSNQSPTEAGAILGAEAMCAPFRIAQRRCRRAPFKRCPATVGSTLQLARWLPTRRPQGP